MDRIRSAMAVSARVGLQAVRLVLFTVLLVASRVLVPLFRLAATAGIVLFGFCALVKREETTPMWAGAAVAVGAVVLELALGAVIRALAPRDVVVISEV